MFYVYILQNPQGHFYIGQTQNLQDRLKRHSENRSTYTKHRGPWTLIYSEEHTSRSRALEREHEIKSHKNVQFIHDLIKVKPAG